MKWDDSKSSSKYKKYIWVVIEKQKDRRLDRVKKCMLNSEELIDKLKRYDELYEELGTREGKK